VADTFHFRGFDIPVDLCLLTGGGPDSFEAISDLHIRNVDDACGLRAGLDVLELGCGIGRDAIPLIDLIGRSGSYVGVDVMGSSIAWCQDHISVRHPNFRFVHHDIRDELHNPAGTVTLDSVRLPADDGSIDLIVLQSVFTHMLPPAVMHYLGEFGRVLRPSGRVYATFFMIDDDILDTARKTNLTQWDLRFEHPIEPGVSVNNPAQPTSAVAYRVEALEPLLARAGLDLAAAIRPGAWSGHHPIAADGQDVMVLRRVPV
jgi:SAM-dependent methyltransferase